MVVLAQTLQWCTIQSGMPLEILCRAVKVLCRYLAPLLEKGDLLDITMLSVTEKDPVIPPIPTERASLLQKRNQNPRRKSQLFYLPQTDGKL